MSQNSINLLVGLNEFIQYDNELKQKYPQIYYCLPKGIATIMDCLMCSFMLEEHEMGVYLEECVNVLDYCLSEEDISNSVMCENLEKATAHLYSYEFYEFLSRIYIRLDEKIKNLLLTNEFMVIDYNTLNRVNKIFIKVNY